MARITYHHRHAAGFTLTELAIVLGIIGLILGAIWAAAGAVSNNSRNNQAIQDITTMADNMRSTFAAVPSFTSSGDKTSVMISAGVIPQALVNPASAGTAIDVWGGLITIAWAPGANYRLFRISYANVPQSACFAIANQLANLGTGDAPVNLVISGTSYAISHTPGSMGLSSSTISSNCVDNATVGFDYTIH